MEQLTPLHLVGFLANLGMILGYTCYLSHNAKRLLKQSTKRKLRL